ncbi:50S ribosomal protein L24 [bacterium]|nr:50S ribosomal protein L24 [bacterium]
MKIKKGDTVIVLTGKDRNKTGKVEITKPKKNTVIVAGVNIKKKHMKPSQQNKQGGIKEFSAPLSTSKIQLVCPKCNKATRIGYEIANEKKERKCKRCNQLI